MSNKITKLKLSYLLLILGFLLFSQIISLSPVHASSCSLYNSSQPVQEGFGASYNVLSPQKETLIKADCQGDSVDIEIGNNSANQYIYKKGYIYRNGWEEIEFKGNGLVANNWYVAKANLHLDLEAGQISENNYIVAYICTWTGNGWKCGCRDNNCINNFWQIQKFKKTETCIDEDHDGYGIEGANYCQFPDIDCNDDPANNGERMNPGQEEVCDDANLDENCNGQIDEGCACVNNDTKSCGLSDVGACQFGTQTCFNGQWGHCTGNIDPQEEICGNDIDENCDGSDAECSGIAHGYPCAPGENEQCDQGLFCKTSSRYNDQNAVHNESYCCAENECAIVITYDPSPSGDSSSNGVYSCVGEGEIGDKYASAGVVPPICHNGEWQEQNICEDKDHDGYGIEGANNCQFPYIDCDDNEEYAHPGGEETCDTIDNDCNGEVDEGCDDDQDGYCDKDMYMYNSNSMCSSTTFNSDGQKGNDPNDEDPNIIPDTNCTDTDGGDNQFQKGQVRANNEIKEDSCLQSGVLEEWYCDANKQKVSKQYTCHCYDGVCLNSPVTASVNAELMEDDAVKISWNVEITNKIDIEIWRAGDNNGSPNDGWTEISSSSPSFNPSAFYSGDFIDRPAQGTYWYGIHIINPNGEVFYESSPPGPAKIVVPGTETCIAHQQRSDTLAAICCDSGDKLKESYHFESAGFVCCASDECVIDLVCTDNGWYSGAENIKCENGNWIEACTDGDNGKDYSRKASIDWTVQNFHAEDYCESDNDNNLVEYYCDQGMYKTATYTCPNGCFDGACLSSSCIDKDNDGYDNCDIGQDGDDGKEIDCDDNERYAYPGGEETCDTVDNNCSGEADEGCDDDGDNYCDDSMMVYRNNTMCYKNNINVADFNSMGVQGDDPDDEDPEVPEPSCIAHGESSITLAAFCCDQNDEFKFDYYDEEAVDFTCCTLSECAYNLNCVSDGYLAEEGDKKCTSGEWQDVQESCVEDWECTSWSSCLSTSTQTRVCTDQNNCGTVINKPIENQDCTTCSEELVDTNQDGDFNECGCSRCNGCLCDLDNDNVADGVCADNECNTVAPVSLNCGIDGCDSGDKNKNISAGIKQGWACDSSFDVFNNNYFTQDGIGVFSEERDGVITDEGSGSNRYGLNTTDVFYDCADANNHTYVAQCSEFGASRQYLSDNCSSYHCGDGVLCDNTLNDGDFNPTGICLAGDCNGLIPDELVDANFNGSCEFRVEGCNNCNGCLCSTDGDTNPDGLCVDGRCIVNGPVVLDCGDSCDYSDIKSPAFVDCSGHEGKACSMFGGGDMGKEAFYGKTYFSQTGVCVENMREGFPSSCSRSYDKSYSCEHNGEYFDQACGNKCSDGDPCDNQNDGNFDSSYGICSGNICNPLVCSEEKVDINQDGSFSLCGCSRAFNTEGFICDVNGDLSGDGICVGNECVVNGAVSMPCFNKECEPYSYRHTYQGCSVGGYSCDNDYVSEGQVFFEQDGVCAQVDGVYDCISSGYACKEGGITYDSCSDCADNSPCALVPTSGGDIQYDDMVCKEGNCEKIISPETFDWRDYNNQNWITPVKNQGGCGSCWAFATVAMLEAKYNIQENNPNLDIDLSEQYLVSDCCNSGTCHGGFSSSCALTDEACYPYQSSDSSCNSRCNDWENHLWTPVTGGLGGATGIKTTKIRLMTQGPLTAYMNSQYIWDSANGYYKCGGTKITHAVLLVGWNDSGGYWIIKNSWGTGWGENGYAKIGYGECNLYPVGYTSKIIAP